MSTPLTNLTATLSSSDRDGTINLAWTLVNDGENEYIRIDRKVVGGVFSLLTLVGAGASAYADTTCAGNTRYYYRVRKAETPVVWSNEDDEWTAPSPPADATFTSVMSENTATLTWVIEGVPTATYYSKKLHTDGTWDAHVVVNYPTATILITGLTEARSYDFRLREYNSASTLYSDYSGTETDTTELNTPTNILATGSGTDVIVSWTDNSSVESGYEVYRKVSGGAYGAALSTTATSPYTDSTVVNGTAYVYKIRAQKDTTYYSPYSAEASCTAGAPPASTPGTPTAVASGQTSISMTWTKGATADYDDQHIFRSTDGTNYSSIDTVAETIETYEDTGLTAYTRYYYKIVSHNVYGYAFSAADDVYTDPDVDAPTGVIATVTGAAQITLTWTNNSTSANSIYIEKMITGGAYAVITESPVTGTAVTVVSGGLTPGVTYTFRLRAYHTASATFGSYSSPVSKVIETVSSGAIIKNRAYFAQGNLLCVASATPSHYMETLYTTKPLGFEEQDQQAANMVKTVDRVQLDYIDNYASTPITMKMSTDGGVTWPAVGTRTRTVGTGAGAQKTVDFTFVPMSGRNFSFQIACNSATKRVVYTGMRIYYFIRSRYIEIS